MADDDVTVTVTDNPGESRYEATLGDAVAGVAQYMRSSQVVAFTHTEVDLAYEGRGVAGALARTALDAAREEGLKVVPVCTFFASYLRKHPEYQDLVYEKEKDGDRA
ncbi:GNAT family N-acetyltransferase [Streptomyces sp. NPDC048172]|uniref:GNAT family N-acetyltransferase n=1 Tax=Streptomyces sp. NPDC048172 TaxID=3365505 RepID=UPI0037119750